MSMFGSDVPSGAHGDVLSATPTDDVSKANLVDEIKRRAKGSIMSKNYPEAVLLYTKAIDIYPDNAILHANRSMCKLSMKQAKNALEDAIKATELDSSYAKGFYRTAAAQIALKQYKSAHASLERGLKLVPGDKDMKKQQDICVKELDRRARNGEPLDGDNEKKAKPSPNPVVSKTTTKGSAVTAAKVTSSDTASSAAPTTATADRIEGDEELGGDIRGYKLTSDGRKTSFFNNEMDEKTKALIGDITPKAITPASAAVPTAALAAGTSAWNSAGTFESRDHSKWARDAVKEALANVTYTLPDGLGVVRISDVSKIDGDAEVASARGKTKHIYDLTATCDWTLQLSKPEDPSFSKQFKGTLTLLDITGDIEYESQTTLDSKGGAPDTESLALIKSYVRKDGVGLIGACYDALKAFHATFKLRV